MLINSETPQERAYLFVVAARPATVSYPERKASNLPTKSLLVVIPPAFGRKSAISRELSMNTLRSIVLVASLVAGTASNTSLAQQLPTVSRTTTLCVASPIGLCNSTDHKLDCAGPNKSINPILKEISQAFCASHGDVSEPNPYITTTLSNVSGGQCGVTRYQVRCKAQPMPSERKTISMCISDGSTKCTGAPPDASYSACGSSVLEFGRTNCRWSDGSIATFYIKTIKNEEGGQCGATLNEVICLLN